MNFPGQGISRIVVDVGPLRERQFTGIPNVVKELVARALAMPPVELEFAYAMGDVLIDPDIIAAVVASASGDRLEEALRSLKGVSPLGLDDRSCTAGLSLHIKSPRRRFAKEALFVHDLSFLSVPRLHERENLNAHLDGFQRQIETTDIFFANSNATKLDLQWYCAVNEQRIHVTHLGHDIDDRASTEMRDRIGGEPEPFLLVLGTIEPRKNVAFLLDWLAANPTILKEIRVVFCGREGWGQTFNELVGSAGLVDALERGRLKHVGFSTSSQRLALLVSARALIFPSLYEGFGLPVLEAIACGTPVLASCSTSIPEVLGPDGFYFDPLSPASLTNAFEEFTGERGGGRLQQRIARLKQRSASFSYDEMFRRIITTITST